MQGNGAAMKNDIIQLINSFGLVPLQTAFTIEVWYRKRKLTIFMDETNWRVGTLRVWDNDLEEYECCTLDSIRDSLEWLKEE